ncbi:pro-sigmaK processing inhibitor BofA family protein [Desulfuribacillus alkaliarsenatis]|uniref:pro-sigmaK processing inhibitor BofA family protein n=1 Tax=Desulfuribacillus alkaliarsenatis TaxID=766136 RepID=UPI0015B456B8|nr:pro-sigmaK processing inhibitor BofA family protein [Desulfuribacillus alkaliarsenatis]
MYQLLILAAVMLVGLFIIYTGKNLYKPLEIITKIFVQVAIGAVCIILFNTIASPIDFKLALNPVTAAITGYLGVPGFIALLVIRLVIA